MLTAAQQKMLVFIEGYIEAHDGVAPTFREMAAGTGLRSTHGVFRIVNGLVERGYIRRLRDRARAIEILKTVPRRVA